MNDDLTFVFSKPEADAEAEKLKAMGFPVQVRYDPTYGGYVVVMDPPQPHTESLRDAKL